MPFAGLAGSDLPRASGFATVRDPYGDKDVLVIPPIQPDIAIIHVQEADEEGNLRLLGAPFEDVLLAKASKRVIATVERLAPRESFVAQPQLTALPAFMVEQAVVASRGAWPTSCHGFYGYDADYLSAYTSAAKNTDAFRTFVQERIVGAPA